MKRKDVLVALSFCLVAVIALAGVLVMQRQADTKSSEENLVDLDEVPDLDGIASWTMDNTPQETASENNKAEVTNDNVLTQAELEERLAENNDMDVPEEILADVSGKTETPEDAGALEAASIDAAAQESPVINFSETSSITWPIKGNVIIDYSMDSTVYFSTLDQYKYNPAIIISAEVNGQVLSAATGIVTAVDVNEETGKTLTMDIGNGYTATYGQLKEVSAEVGDTIEAGAVLGYVSEPTKYYSVEGSNLYFKLEQHGVPVDPMDYLQ